MARRAVEPLPEPPWVWGPSEVDAWIGGSHPSRRRSSGGPPRHAAKIAHFRVRVGGGNARDVRTAVVRAFEAIGFSRVDTRGSRIAAKDGLRSAVAHVRDSLFGRDVVVSIRFNPPTFRSKCKHLLHLLPERFDVHSVHSKESGEGLPAKW